MAFIDIAKDEKGEPEIVLHLSLDEMEILQETINPTALFRIYRCFSKLSDALYKQINAVDLKKIKR